MASSPPNSKTNEYKKSKKFVGSVMNELLRSKDMQLVSAIATHKHYRRKLEAKVSGLRAEVATAHDQVKSKEFEITEYDQTIGVLNRALFAQHSDQNLARELNLEMLRRKDAGDAASRAAVDKASQDLEALRKQVQLMHQEIAAKTANETMLARNMATLRRALEMLLARAENVMGMKGAEAVEELIQDAEQDLAQVKELEGDAMLLRMAEDRQKNVREMSTVKKEMEKLQAEKKNMETALKKAEGDVVQMRLKLMERESTMALANKKVRAIESKLEEEAADAQARLQEAEKAAADLQSRYEKRVKDINEKLDSAQSQVSVLTHRGETLRQQMAQVRAELDQKQEQFDEKLEKQRLDLTKQLQEEQQKATAAEELRQREAKAAQSKLSQMEKDLQFHTREVQSLRDENDKISNAHIAAESTAREQLQQLSQLQKELSKSTQERRHLNDKIKKAQEEIEKINQEFESKLEEADQRQARLILEAKEAKQDLASLHQTSLQQSDATSTLKVPGMEAPSRTPRSKGGKKPTSTVSPRNDVPVFDVSDLSRDVDLQPPPKEWGTMTPTEGTPLAISLPLEDTSINEHGTLSPTLPGKLTPRSEKTLRIDSALTVANAALTKPSKTNLQTCAEALGTKIQQITSWRQKDKRAQAPHIAIRCDEAVTKLSLTLVKISQAQSELSSQTQPIQDDSSKRDKDKRSPSKKKYVAGEEKLEKEPSHQTSEANNAIAAVAERGTTRAKQQGVPSIPYKPFEVDGLEDVARGETQDEAMEDSGVSAASSRSRLQTSSMEKPTPRLQPKERKKQSESQQEKSKVEESVITPTGTPPLSPSYVQKQGTWTQPAEESSAAASTTSVPIDEDDDCNKDGKKPAGNRRSEKLDGTSDEEQDNDGQGSSASSASNPASSATSIPAPAKFIKTTKQKVDLDDFEGAASLERQLLDQRRVSLHSACMQTSTPRGIDTHDSEMQSEAKALSEKGIQVEVDDGESHQGDHKSAATGARMQRKFGGKPKNAIGSTGAPASPVSLASSVASPLGPQTGASREIQSATTTAPTLSPITITAPSKQPPGKLSLNLPKDAAAKVLAAKQQAENDPDMEKEEPAKTADSLSTKPQAEVITMEKDIVVAESNKQLLEKRIETLAKQKMKAEADTAKATVASEVLSRATDASLVAARAEKQRLAAALVAAEQAMRQTLSVTALRQAWELFTQHRRFLLEVEASRGMAPGTPLIAPISEQNNSTKPQSTASPLELLASSQVSSTANTPLGSTDHRRSLPPLSSSQQSSSLMTSNQQRMGTPTTTRIAAPDALPASTSMAEQLNGATTLHSVLKETFAEALTGGAQTATSEAMAKEQQEERRRQVQRQKEIWELEAAAAVLGDIMKLPTVEATQTAACPTTDDATSPLLFASTNRPNIPLMAKDDTQTSPFTPAKENSGFPFQSFGLTGPSATEEDDSDDVYRLFANMDSAVTAAANKNEEEEKRHQAFMEIQQMLVSTEKLKLVEPSEHISSVPVNLFNELIQQNLTLRNSVVEHERTRHQNEAFQIELQQRAQQLETLTKNQQEEMQKQQLMRERNEAEKLNNEKDNSNLTMRKVQTAPLGSFLPKPEKQPEQQTTKTKEEVKDENTLSLTMVLNAVGAFVREAKTLEEAVAKSPEKKSAAASKGESLLTPAEVEARLKEILDNIKTANVQRAFGKKKSITFKEDEPEPTAIKKEPSVGELSRCMSHYGAGPVILESHKTYGENFDSEEDEEETGDPLHNGTKKTAVKKFVIQQEAGTDAQLDILDPNEVEQLAKEYVKTRQENTQVQMQIDELLSVLGHSDELRRIASVVEAASSFTPDVTFYRSDETRIMAQKEKAIQRVLITVKNRLHQLKMEKLMDENVRAGVGLAIHTAAIDPIRNQSSLRGVIKETRTRALKAMVAQTTAEFQHTREEEEFLAAMFQSFPRTFIERIIETGCTPEACCHLVEHLGEWWNTWRKRADLQQLASVQAQQESLKKLLELCDLLERVSLMVNVEYGTLQGDDGGGRDTPPPAAQVATYLAERAEKGHSRLVKLLCEKTTTPGLFAKTSVTNVELGLPPIASSGARRGLRGTPSLTPQPFELRNLTTSSLRDMRGGFRQQEQAIKRSQAFATLRTNTADAGENAFAKYVQRGCDLQDELLDAVLTTPANYSTRHQALTPATPPAPALLFNHRLPTVAQIGRTKTPSGDDLPVYWNRAAKGRNTINSKKGSR